MKKILFLSMLAALVGFASCSKTDEMSNGPQADEQRATFTVEAPAATRANATALTRYVAEAYAGKDLTATPQRVENSTGSLTLTLKKDTEYTVLFWADKGTAGDAIATSGDYYDATALQDVKVNSAAYATAATPAYCLAMSFNSNDFAANKTVVLKNATAQINFVEAAGLAEAGNSLTVKYSSGGKLNVATGKIVEIGTEISRTYDNIGKIEKDKTLVTDYILAPLGEKRILNLKVTLNSETEKVITNVPLQQSYKTNIKGQYSNMYSSVFTISNEMDDYVDNPDMDLIPSMKLTVDTRKNTNNTSDATFILPLQTTLSGYALKVDWGDGNTDEFADGTVLAQANMTHTYAAAGVYQITIGSSQEDVTNVQMPKIDFYNNYVVNENPAKLISLDTPLLNMYTYDFMFCFEGCKNLTSISATLFENNTATADFTRCFNGCTGLTTLPAGLFEKNTAATNFTQCFFRCTGLTSIPAGLFEKNTAATTFTNCFGRCTGLTTLPATLFEKNPLVTNFYSCFSGCTGLTTLPATLFEKNTAAGSFGSCFDGCTGLTSIPAGLFEKNTEATYFDGCFDGCTKAVLNSDIFCSEASDKTTRFAGKTMGFSGCFKDCGSDSSVAAGAGGVAPELWTYTMDISSTKPGCFTNVTKVTNAASIPAGWK